MGDGVKRTGGWAMGCEDFSVREVVNVGGSAGGEGEEKELRMSSIFLSKKESKAVAVRDEGGGEERV